MKSHLNLNGFFQKHSDTLLLFLPSQHLSTSFSFTASPPAHSLCQMCLVLKQAATYGLWQSKCLSKPCVCVRACVFSSVCPNRPHSWHLYIKDLRNGSGPEGVANLFSLSPSPSWSWAVSTYSHSWCSLFRRWKCSVLDFTQLSLGLFN